ncbi:Rv3654c family TadE-like protein [Streptosporangium sp. NPDC000396]|uniref:Rv3654c family TadE-like protein n=1 Tax=Streptosporangium sp. NPDC000396 TaxID=3366185 RepID=UPI003698BC10
MEKEWKTGQEGGTGRRRRRECRGWWERGERGSATIWAVGVVGLIFAVGTAIMVAGTVRVARHRAQSAADLSALAAARLAFADPNRGCVEASSLAEGNKAKLTRCSIDGDGIAEVQVAVELSLPVAGSRTIIANARAGPVHIADSVG